MKSGLLFLLLCILAKDASCFSSMFMNVLSEEWETYKLKFSKVYDNLFEEQLRMRVYAEKKLKVADHNQKYYEGKVSYLIGMNHFSDMLPHELSRYKGLKMDFSNKRNDGVTFIGPHESIVLPESMDWREHGAVTPIKNQGPCGSCWAFAAVGSLEGQHFRKTKKLVSLSEQNLVDCIPNEGCEGGQMTDAFIYVRDNNGIDTEESYPYLAIDADCRFNKSTIGATDKGYTKLPVGDENAMLEAVATIGPITVGIDASEYGFDDYKEGVYHSPDCSKTRLDHGVLVVGYGTNEKGEDYWLVKNSWGKYWGMNGYGMMARNKDNNCGIATEATYPLV